jgi:hypothetical protein
MVFDELRRGCRSIEAHSVPRVKPWTSRAFFGSLTSPKVESEGSAEHHVDQRTTETLFGAMMRSEGQ